MYKNDQRRIIDAKLVMDNLVADTQGWFSELGIDQHKLFNTWVALDHIIKSEGLDYKIASKNPSEIIIEHWTQVDDALKYVRDLVAAVDDEEIRSSYEEQFSIIEDAMDSAGIDY